MATGGKDLPGQDKPLHKRVLNKVFRNFVSDLDPGSLLDVFKQQSFIQDNQIRDLREMPTTSDKNRAIMNRVSQLGPDGYDKFKKCLRMSDQNYLADILNKTEQELRNCDKTNRSNQDPELANTLQENDDYTSLFQTEEERCWLKSWLAIHYTREGLLNFVVQGIEKFRENAEKTLPQSVAEKCGQSTGSHQINGDYLNHMKSEIEKANKFRPPWSNTDQNNWCCSLWEIAKCFIHAKGYKTKLSADKTDLNGVLQIILNCRHFQNFFHCDMAGKNICSLVMQKVNEVRHSPNMEHTQAATEYLINSFLTLLSDSKYLNTDEYAKTAREKLEKLKSGDLPSDTSSVLKSIVEDAKTEAEEPMKQKLDKLLEKIDAIEVRQHTMQERLSDHESRLHEVERRFKEMVLNIENGLPSSALSYGYDEVDQRNGAVDSIPVSDIPNQRTQQPEDGDSKTMDRTTQTAGPALLQLEHVSKQTKLIASYIVIDFKKSGNYMDAPDKYCMAMGEAVQMMSDSYDIQSSVQGLLAGSGHLLQNFTGVSDTLFGDGQISWGRTIAMFAFVAKLIEEYGSHVSEDMDKFAQEVGIYASQKLDEWIFQNGGWQNFEGFWTNLKKLKKKSVENN